MTPEERAGAVLRGWYGRYMNLDQRRAELAAAVREAVAAERERCAVIVEGEIRCDCLRTVGFCECYGASTLTSLAARIREGGAA